MRKRKLAIVGFMLAISLPACATHPSRAVEQAAPPVARSQVIDLETSCPFSHPGVEILVADVPGGVSLTIVGGQDQVAFLRRWGARRAAMASGTVILMMYGPAEEEGMMGAEGMMRRLGLRDDALPSGPARNRPVAMIIPIPSSDGRANDVSGGVRLTFKARDPQHVTVLREQLRQHVSMMRAGMCPVMPNNEL